MALRLTGLDDLDLRHVALPSGTEVVTRVDREVGGKVRRQGAVGRVIGEPTGVAGDQFVVAFVDGARATYQRDELTPRKRGEVRYARRRDDAWAALRANVVVDAVVGSRAWGLADVGSDEDHRGVMVLPLPWTTGLVDPPGEIVSADGSSTYWELGKAIRQALRADPNTLEMLMAAPAPDDELGAGLWRMRAGFVSQQIYGTFGRYALSQLDRLQHNDRLATHRALVLAWLAEAPGLGIDAVAERLADAAAIAAPTRADAVARARDYLKQLYRSLADQGVIASAEWRALATFARTPNTDDAMAVAVPPRDLRPKNAYNLVRLLDLAQRWLRGEPPDVRASEAVLPTLRAIKRGELTMAEVVALAQAMAPALELAREHSPLPLHGDVEAADTVLRAVRHEAARRWVTGAPGPWGTDAAHAPMARVDA